MLWGLTPEFPDFTDPVQDRGSSTDQQTNSPVDLAGGSREQIAHGANDQTDVTKDEKPFVRRDCTIETFHGALLLFCVTLVVQFLPTGLVESGTSLPEGGAPEEGTLALCQLRTDERL